MSSRSLSVELPLFGPTALGAELDVVHGAAPILLLRQRVLAEQLPHALPRHGHVLTDLLGHPLDALQDALVLDAVGQGVDAVHGGLY